MTCRGYSRAVSALDLIHNNCLDDPNAVRKSLAKCAFPIAWDAQNLVKAVCLQAKLTSMSYQRSHQDKDSGPP